MDEATRFDILHKLPPLEPTDDPQLLEQREWLLKELLKMDPVLHDRIVKPEIEAAVHAALNEEREAAVREREAARKNGRRLLRGVLAARGLALTSEQAALIDAQTDMGTLNRWIEQAATAASAADALV